MSNERKNTGKRKYSNDAYKKASAPKSRAPKAKASAKKAETKSAPVKKTAPTEIRLNKYIANSGMCSRREADMHISIGSVTVNGKVVSEMGYKVKIDDDVRFDGARISPERKAYVLLNKPKGFATTTSESKGKTVMDLVANATNSRIKPIGRLGRNSTGLLLFTNDDDLTKKFTNSKTGVKRLFQVELDKNLKLEDLKKIKEGITIEGKKVTVVEASYITNKPKKELGIAILNTGNGVLRTIFEHLGYDLLKVDCVMIGDLTKKDIPRGHWKHLTEQELINLKHFK
ncbi:MAG: pseudouridine synthase [Flavobacteriaceae bacterium]